MTYVFHCQGPLARAGASKRGETSAWRSVEVSFNFDLLYLWKFFMEIL